MSETEVSHLSPKRVFIIGAGMSADCGTPIIRNFLEERFLSLVNEEDQKKYSNFSLMYISQIILQILKKYYQK